MKSVGEVMAIGRKFEETFQKVRRNKQRQSQSGSRSGSQSGLGSGSQSGSQSGWGCGRRFGRIVHKDPAKLILPVVSGRLMGAVNGCAMGS